MNGYVTLSKLGTRDEAEQKVVNPEPREGVLHGKEKGQANYIHVCVCMCVCE